MDIVQRFVSHGDFEAFANDRASQMIVERGLGIVSEASRHLPPEIKQRHPEIPWKNIQNIGNVLRHEYDRTSQGILWKTARERVPELAEVCRAELELANTPKQTLPPDNDLADRLLEAGREHARTKRQEPTQPPQIDNSPSLWPDYSKGLELKKTDK